MDLSRRARAAVLYAVLSGALAIAMAGAAALFVEAPPVPPRHAAALLLPTTPRVAPSIAPVATATFPSATAGRQALHSTPRPTSGPTPPVPATTPCSGPSCADHVAAAAPLPPVELIDGALVDPLDDLVGGPLGDLAGSVPDIEVPTP